MPTFQGSGINEDQIENYKHYADILQSLTCCLCLEIVKNPFECSTCESGYCGECWEGMKISGKTCVFKCTTPVVKANKFVYDILEKLQIKCGNCNKGGICYSKYTLHENACIIYDKYSVPSEGEKIGQSQSQEIESLKKTIEDMKNNNLRVSTFKLQDTFSCYTPEQIREKLITFKGNVNLKMELYNATVEGRGNDFKNMVLNRGYPVLEEVSAHNYYWTPLHYAMHYGQMEIAYFILDGLKKNGDLELAMLLQSNDKRCPLGCLLKSNTGNNDQKKQYLEQVLGKFDFMLSPEVTKEIKNRNMEALINKYRK